MTAPVDLDALELDLMWRDQARNVPTLIMELRAARQDAAMYRVALSDLLHVIEIDMLIPETVSYMRQARAAIAKGGPT